MFYVYNCYMLSPAYGWSLCAGFARYILKYNVMRVTMLLKMKIFLELFCTATVASDNCLFAFGYCIPPAILHKRNLSNLYLF